jgi:hypothetical protein
VLSLIGHSNLEAVSPAAKSCLAPKPDAALGASNTNKLDSSVDTSYTVGEKRRTIQNGEDIKGSVELNLIQM